MEECGVAVETRGADMTVGSTCISEEALIIAHRHYRDKQNPCDGVQSVCVCV